MKPDAWITGGSLWKLRNGDPEWRYQVPVHSRRSDASVFPLYASDTIRTWLEEEGLVEQQIDALMQSLKGAA